MPAPGFVAKIATPATLAGRISALPRPLVFTNGVFDILHRGHVTYLDHARSLGAALVVGVNSDASVRRLAKGMERPLNPLEDRLAVLAALESVDLVVPFDEDTPLALVVACHPDIIVKGGDYTVGDYGRRRRGNRLGRSFRGDSPASRTIDHATRWENPWRRLAVTH